MTRDEVVVLMAGSTSEMAWNINCNVVKQAHGGEYPEYWYAAILDSGLAGRMQALWTAQATATDAYPFACGCVDRVVPKGGPPVVTDTTHCREGHGPPAGEAGALQALIREAETATVIFGRKDGTSMAVPLAEVLVALGTPLLYKGDRIAFSKMFLETGLHMAQHHPEQRTIYVELTAASDDGHGGKLVGVQRNVCPICSADINETPHDMAQCPNLPIPEV